MSVVSRSITRIAAFSLVLCLSLAGVALAADDTLTVRQAVELAKNNSATLQIAKLTLANDQITWNKSQNSNPTPLAERSARLAWEKAQATYSLAESDLATTTLNRYLDVQNAAITLSIRAKQADQANRALDKAKILAEKGSLGPTDVLTAEMSAKQSENALDQARDAYTAAVSSLQRLLGVETLPALPSASILIIPEISMSLEDAVTAGLASSSTIKDLENSLELQTIIRAQDVAIGLAAFDDAKSQNDLKKAELQLAEAKANRVESITSQYNGLVQARKALDLQITSYQLTQKQFEISQKQMQAGMKTAADLEKDEISLIQADQSLRSAERSFVSAWLSFQGTLGNPINLTEVVKTDAGK